MPRTKKEETTTEKKVIKKTTKKVVDNLSNAIKNFNDYINLDFSNITTSLIKDIKENENVRSEKVSTALEFVKNVENKCRGYYMNGNQYALSAINLHLSRMNNVLEVYEFLYTQISDTNTKRIILNNILYVINDMMYPRQYEKTNSFGITYEKFIMNVNISNILANKFNYYNMELGKLR